MAESDSSGTPLDTITPIVEAKDQVTVHKIPYVATPIEIKYRRDRVDYTSLSISLERMQPRREALMAAIEKQLLSDRKCLVITQLKDTAQAIIDDVKVPPGKKTAFVRHDTKPKESTKDVDLLVMTNVTYTFLIGSEDFDVDDAFVSYPTRRRPPRGLHAKSMYCLDDRQHPVLTRE